MHFTERQKQTRKKILELSYELKRSHLGSCLSAVDIIDAVYEVKKKEERFVLSGGHAATALYAILEKNHIIDSSTIRKLPIHPDRNMDFGIDVSSGSLGQGLPIALGMALSDRKKKVFCMITDGECAEGSIWESLRVMCDHKIDNLIIIVNANGWGAYDVVSLPMLLRRIKGFGLNVVKTNGHDIGKLLSAIKRASKNPPSVIFAKTNVEQFSFLKGQDAHYYVMNEHDYQLSMEMVK